MSSLACQNHQISIRTCDYVSLISQRMNSTSSCSTTHRPSQTSSIFSVNSISRPTGHRQRRRGLQRQVKKELYHRLRRYSSSASLMWMESTRRRIASIDYFLNVLTQLWYLEAHSRLLSFSCMGWETSLTVTCLSRSLARCIMERSQGRSCSRSSRRAALPTCSTKTCSLRIRAYSSSCQTRKWKRLWSLSSLSAHCAASAKSTSCVSTRSSTWRSLPMTRRTSATRSWRRSGWRVWWRSQQLWLMRCCSLRRSSRFRKTW